MGHTNKLRGTVPLLAAALLLALLTGCGWHSRDSREDAPEKTYIVVVEKERSVPSKLESISSELDKLLGEDWADTSHQVIVIYR